jgi:hypothetical protein
MILRLPIGRPLSSLLHVEVQQEVREAHDRTEEDAQEGDIRPPERLVVEAEYRHDSAAGYFNLNAIL